MLQSHFGFKDFKEVNSVLMAVIAHPSENVLSIQVTRNFVEISLGSLKLIKVTLHICYFKRVIWESDMGWIVE